MIKKIIYREVAQNDKYTQSYINNFKQIVDNLKSGYITKSENKCVTPYQLNKENIKQNPNFLLACFAT